MTTRAVAEAAGVRPGLVHYYFGSMEELKVIVAAVTSFQLGLIVEGLSGVHEGHEELLDWIQRWVDDLEAGAAGGPDAAGPVAAGPVAAGPVATGPVTAGGPVAAGPDQTAATPSPRRRVTKRAATSRSDPGA